MPTVVEMPRLSDTMEEGTLASWHKGVGDRVSAGDALADIETDKAIQTFESFDDGVLLALIAAEGDTLPLRAPIAILGAEGEDVSALEEELRAKVKALLEGGPAESGGGDAPSRAEDEDEAPAESEAAAKQEAPAPPDDGDDDDEPGDEPDDEPDAKRRSADPAAREAPVDDEGIRILASPLARRIAAERRIDLRTVEGSGPRGRIVVADLDGLEPTRRVMPGAPGAPAGGPPREDEVVRVSQMRKTIAKRLVESKHSAPHYYLTVTLDAGPLVALRREINATQERLRVSYNDLVLRACVVALGRHPAVNAAWEGTTIRRFAGVHLGFAVALEAGLITPVVRDADRLGLLDLGEAVRALAERAHEQRLEGHEYSGASFTVSNLGMFGIDHFTAVINPPAACILAVGALTEAPVVRDGAVVAGHRMTLTLSCDHRAVDGAVGAAFLADLKTTLEAPLGLLLG